MLCTHTMHCVLARAHACACAGTCVQGCREHKRNIISAAAQAGRPCAQRPPICSSSAMPCTGPQPPLAATCSTYQASHGRRVHDDAEGLLLGRGVAHKALLHQATAAAAIQYVCGSACGTH